MKKLLYTALSLLALASIPAQAQVRLYETFTYPDGLTTNVSGALWKVHSGGGTDSFVSSNRLQVFGTRSDDVNRILTNSSGTAYTNKSAVFAAFTINMSSLPVNSNGTYFAHFKDNSTGFRARVAAVTGNNGFVPYSVAPGFYRLGISVGNGDGSGTISSGPTGVAPLDMALNTDYQVVMQYDQNSGGSTKIWINPLTTNDVSAAATDTFTNLPNGISGMAFRQNSGQAQQTVDNVVVGDTFADVVTNVPFGPPVFGISPVGTTNYSGNAFSMSGVVSGRGALTYQWTQNGGNIASATDSTYSIASLAGSDNGTYTLVVSNTYGSSVTSAPTVISVNTTPTAPFIGVQPVGYTNQIGTTFTLSPTVGGTGPLTFQWNQNGSPAPGPDANSQVYKITGATTNDSGNYTLVVSGPGGPPATSSNAVVLIKPATPTPIGYLRNLENTNTWTPTDTTTLFSITGTVINPTSPTTSTTSSYYVQDATGGINLFITGTSGFRPALGAVVTAVGPLASFNGNLELSLNTGNSFHTFSDTGTTNALPAPVVFSPLSTNNVPYMEALESSLILMTNVYFKLPATNGLSYFTNGVNYIITNSAGVTFTANIGSIVSNLNGVTIPSFAWSLSGVLVQNNSTTNTKAGYQIFISQPSDITTTAPNAVTASAAITGGNVNLSWTAQPYHYAYSVLSATNASGPYSVVVSGLTFTNTLGTYTSAVVGGTAKYYRVTSP